MPPSKEDMRAHWNVQTFCLLTLTLIALGGALYFLRPVLVPFVLAVLLTNCLMPVIEFQQRRLRAPRGVAVASTLVMMLVIVAICGSFVAASIGGASQRLGYYEKQFQHFTEGAARSVSIERLGIDFDTSDLTRYFAVQEGTGWQFMTSVLGEATNLLSSGVIVLIFMLFLIFSQPDGKRHSGMLGEIEANVQRYLVTLVLLSLATGLLVGATLATLGVEMAWVFAFLTFLLNFVPTIGAIVAWFLPLPVILLNPDMSITAKALALVIPAVIHFVIGSLIQPKVQGDALALHPVVVLLALMFFGMIWGIMGAFLATPIAAVVRIVCERIPVLHPVAAVLGGDLAAISAEDRTTDIGTA
jgi:AI-2 transport protein TqsA